MEILGDGKQTKPYIYVEDLVNAIMYFHLKPKEGVLLYNIGAEGTTSVTEIADIVCSEMGLRDVKYQYTGGNVGWKGDVPKFRYCLDKVHCAGWRAKMSSEEAVRRAVRDNL